MQHMINIRPQLFQVFVTLINRYFSTESLKTQNSRERTSDSVPLGEEMRGPESVKRTLALYVFYGLVRGNT